MVNRDDNMKDTTPTDDLRAGALNTETSNDPTAGPWQDTALPPLTGLAIVEAGDVLVLQCTEELTAGEVEDMGRSLSILAPQLHFLILPFYVEAKAIVRNGVAD